MRRAARFKKKESLQHNSQYTQNYIASRNLQHCYAGALLENLLIICLWNGAACCSTSFIYVQSDQLALGHCFFFSLVQVKGPIHQGFSIACTPGTADGKKKKKEKRTVDNVL